jgi:hypothetical protein
MSKCFVYTHYSRFKQENKPSADEKKRAYHIILSIQLSAKPLSYDYIRWFTLPWQEVEKQSIIYSTHFYHIYCHLLVLCLIDDKNIR